MSAAAIFQILAYSTIPDWLFKLIITPPLAVIAVVLFDVALEKWREK